MNRILHGIRRSSCWPVAAPLEARYLLARLKPLLLTNLQPSGYGDLLPHSGDEDEDENGDLLPHSGDDENGDLLPHSGDDEYGDLLPHSGDEIAVNLDPQPSIKGQVRNNLGIPLPQISGVDAEFVVVFTEENTSCAASVKDDVAIIILPAFKSFVFDPGGHPLFPQQVCSACHAPSMTSVSPHAYVAGDKPYIKVEPTVQVIAAIPTHDPNSLSIQACGNHICYVAKLVHPDCMQREEKSGTALLEIGTCKRATTTRRIIIHARGLHLNHNQQGCIWFTATIGDAIFPCLLFIWRFPHPPPRVKIKLMQAPETCDNDAALLWLNESNYKESAAAYFLIPLRGSMSDQWNDEALDEDVAALKTKTTRRTTAMRLSYLMKDLLDPG